MRTRRHDLLKLWVAFVCHEVGGASSRDPSPLYNRVWNLQNSWWCFKRASIIDFLSFDLALINDTQTEKTLAGLYLLAPSRSTTTATDCRWTPFKRMYLITTSATETCWTRQTTCTLAPDALCCMISPSYPSPICALLRCGHARPGRHCRRSATSTWKVI